MMDDYGEEGATPQTDPADIDFDHYGKPVEDEEPVAAFKSDATGTKIDYSSTPPVPFQKTATVVNYFITNTAQFLNTFSQVAETKLHEVDERLDEIEQILALYESKLDLPEEYFESMPDMPAPEPKVLEVVARTENPLLNAMDPVAAAPAARAKTVKQAKKGGGVTEEGPKSYVPPPPKDGTKIPAPAGVPNVKLFPISQGPPPAGMKFPGI